MLFVGFYICFIPTTETNLAAICRAIQYICIYSIIDGSSRWNFGMHSYILHGYECEDTTHSLYFEVHTYMFHIFVYVHIYYVCAHTYYIHTSLYMILRTSYDILRVIYSAVQVVLCIVQLLMHMYITCICKYVYTGMNQQQQLLHCCGRSFSSVVSSFPPPRWLRAVWTKPDYPMIQQYGVPNIYIYMISYDTPV